MEEFLRSHPGVFVWILLSVGPFLLSGMGSIWCWKPRWIILGELLLALVVGGGLGSWQPSSSMDIGIYFP
ncbi:MAG: hypothetical protein K6T71_00940 [Candidatus Bipolaricaulota bacterium]|nr:hypothetical protein [Candidatus Bipolaricaulota bacterium]